MVINLNQRLSKNFILNEFIKSTTATNLKIDNLPSQIIVDRLKLVCVNILQPIRDYFGKPVMINSGYRCPKLNAAIKGAKNSQHVLGMAVDFEIIGMNNYDLAIWVKNNLKFDQLILEYATNLKQNPNNGWVHCSFNENNNRQQILTINNKGTFLELRNM